MAYLSMTLASISCGFPLTDTGEGSRIIFDIMNMMVFETSASQVFDQQARFLKLLAHPARLAILDVLRQDEACVCHLEAVLGLRQAYISQQLALLREGGLIEDRRGGWNVFYRVSDRRIFDLLDMLRKMKAEDAPETRYENRQCPCPKCNGVMYPL